MQTKRKRSIIIFTSIILMYFSVVLMANVIESLEFLFPILITPFISIYYFHELGIPYLLERNGNCGMGWCAPTVFGWFFLITFCLGVIWILVWFFNEMPFIKGRD